MSRTRLCVVTAFALVLASASITALRYHVLGHEARFPLGSHTYKVTLLMRGKAAADARLVTACPLDFQRQHIFGEELQSDQLAARPAEARDGGRRHLHWTLRPTVPAGPFTARYQFFCTVDMRRPSSAMLRMQEQLQAPPRPGQYLDQSPGIDPGLPEISDLAREITEGLDQPLDQVRAMFRHVDAQIEKEPRAGLHGHSALECLQQGRGDALAKARLLTALCRSRGIPARLVAGLLLHNHTEQKAHTWVEAWVDDFWLPMCPFHHHFGKVPAPYLVFGHGDLALVRGSNVRELDYACLIDHLPRSSDTGEQASWLRRLFRRVSLYSLPPAEGRLVEFLLLLPVAALLICVFRNLVGLPSFGTFTPALIGLAFRRVESLPGLLVFVCILLIGWGLRRVLDRYHLLQVPRTAFMLTLVVILLIGAILVASSYELSSTHYISLFPLVILTGMIERFWTLENEDGAWTSFKTLLWTLLMAVTISLLLSIPALVKYLVRFPETLGIIMACQLLIGRYTGYRLAELWRFRDLLHEEPISSTAEPAILVIRGPEAPADTFSRRSESGARPRGTPSGS
jgi:hypothetical protein